MIALLRSSLEHDRPAVPGVAAAVLLLSFANLLPTFWPRLDHQQAETFWMGVGLILLPCVFGLTARAALCLWLPAAAFLPSVVAYTLVAESPVRTWTFVVLLETHWSELERFWAAAFLSTVLAPLSVWLLWRIITRHVPAGHRLSWPAKIVIALMAGIVPAGYLARCGWDFGSMVAQRKLSATFPPGLAMSAWDAWRIRSQTESRRNVARDLEVTARSPAPREIYVLVIGESARFSSFQINGYQRETTPLLARTEGWLSFQEVAAPATVTLMSVPVLLTPSTAATLGGASALPSVLSIFKRAGFHTAWFSTQKKHGMYDTASSIFAGEADESLFLSGTFAPGSRPYASALDGALIKPVHDLLARNDPKLFVVLHTMGSHQHYCQRFPDEFNHFPSNRVLYQGSFLTGKFSAAERENLTNAYDNSIRYTDWVLSQLVETLSATHAVSALYYVADHGQNMGDSPTLPFAHGCVTRDVIHVPLLVWLSSEYRTRRAGSAAALESHLRTPFSADRTFHTVIDLAGLDCRFLNRTRSFASASFEIGPRLVRDLAGRVLDFDALKNRSPGPDQTKGRAE